MKKILFAGAICFTAAAAMGALCNDTYYLQGAKQVMRVGTNAGFTQSVKTLKSDLTNIDTLFAAMVYKIPLSFKPDCAKKFPPDTITYWKKAANQTAFAKSVEPYPNIDLNDTDSRLTGHPEYLYWFGFYPLDTINLNFFMGRDTGANKPFENWYGIAYLEDSTLNTTTGKWSSNIRLLSETTGPLDSALLDHSLFIDRGWSDTLALRNANRHPVLHVQTIKVSFDTIAPTALHASASKASTGFSAWQEGRSLWINVGENFSTKGTDVELCDMFGRKVAALRPAGAYYVWNGQAFGRQASPGVYFARIGNRVLGKFVYGR